MKKIETVGICPKSKLSPEGTNDPLGVKMALFLNNFHPNIGESNFIFDLSLAISSIFLLYFIST